MRILSIDNTIVDTDMITSPTYFSILSFRDYKNPDFYMEKLPYIDEVQSASIAIQIGPWNLVIPYHWSILITDYEMVDCVLLKDAIGKTFSVLCMNPIDGYIAQFYTLKTGMIYPNTTWTAPPLPDKDMLVVPLGYESKRKERLGRDKKPIAVGPVCAIFSPTKMEINKSLSDIW